MTSSCLFACLHIEDIYETSKKKEEELLTSLSFIHKSKGILYVSVLPKLYCTYKCITFLKS